MIRSHTNMNLSRFILDYQAVQPIPRWRGWRRRLILTGKLIGEFVILAILALGAVWLGRVLVASH